MMKRSRNNPLRLGEFIRDKTGAVLLHMASMAALSIFLYLTGTAPGLLALVLTVWAAVLTAVLLTQFFLLSARLKELESVMDSLDKKYLFCECAPKPAGLYERKLFQLMRRSGKSMIEAVSDAENARREYREYIESWVHEIKAPITAAELVCNNRKTEQSRKLTVLLAQIEEHVERALYYARSDGAEKDFIVRETELAEIVRNAVARHQTLLIQSGVSVEAEAVSGAVYTDGKWVSFMIGQMLSNAIRYKKNIASSRPGTEAGVPTRDCPLIRFETKRRGDILCLTVTDNGIGIPAGDLPRIFDRGFTGSNGRVKGNSTGMGLYICKKLADFLQIELEAHSVQGAFTEISMGFSNYIFAADILTDTANMM
ncbi:MAG: sensor histidine kinase [Clostridiales bacterium]|jgi:signal transduction histidine kinase|nr:sensor histidine kinase [Clostridiales bacterium]